MAFNVGELQATLTLDPSDLKKGIEDAKKSIQDFGKEVGSGVGGSLNGSLKDLKNTFNEIAVAGTASLVALGFGINSVVKEYGQAEQASARLAQITKTSVGATKEQIQALTDQATALQNTGVVSKDNITVAQGTLATFDLQTESIRALTPAVLDYAVAEKGASFSADELRGLTNGLAQALQGNFTSLTKTGFVLDEETKSMIENGTETERVSALVKVLNSTYAGMNETMRNTSAGGMQAMRNSIDDIKESLGSALIPAVNALVSSLVPATEAMKNFADSHPLIIRSATGIGVALATTAMAIGTVGSMAMKAKLMFQTLGSTVASQIAIFGTLIGVVIATAIAINSMMGAIGNYNAQVAEANGRGQQYEMIANRMRNGTDAQKESAKKLFWEMKNGGNEVESLGSKMTDMGGAGSDSAKKVKDAFENMVESIKKENDDYKESLKSLVIQHNKTIEDITGQINEENENFKKVQAEKREEYEESLESAKKSHNEKIAYLKEEFAEETALLAMKTKSYEKDKTALADKHANELSELQDKIDQELSWGVGANQDILADLQKRVDDENKEYASKLENIEDGYKEEVARSKKKTSDITSDLNKEKVEYKRKYIELKNDRAKDYQDELSTHRKSIASLTKRLNEEMAIKKKHESDFAQYKNAKLADDITKLKENHNIRLAEIRKEYAKELSSAKSTAGGVSGAFGDAFKKMEEDAKKSLEQMNKENKTFWDKVYDGILVARKWFRDKFINNLKNDWKDFWSWFGLSTNRLYYTIVGTLKGIANTTMNILSELINRWATKVNEVKNYIPVLKNLLPDLPTNFSMPNFALDGVMGAGANGIENWQGGRALVGEKGPEIVELPRGANVIPNDQSKKMMGGINIQNFNAYTQVDLDLLLKRAKFFAI